MGMIIRERALNDAHAKAKVANPRTGREPTSVVAEQTRTQLALLNDLMAIAGATKNVADILDQSLGVLLSMLEGSVGCAYLLADGGDSPELAAHRGLTAEHLVQLRACRVAGSFCQEFTGTGGSPYGLSVCALRCP